MSFGGDENVLELNRVDGFLHTVSTLFLVYFAARKKGLRGGEMGQQIKLLATKPDPLSAIPGTDVMGGKNLILASYIQIPPHK